LKIKDKTDADGADAITRKYADGTLTTTPMEEKLSQRSMAAVIVGCRPLLIS